MAGPALGGRLIQVPTAPIAMLLDAVVGGLLGSSIGLRPTPLPRVRTMESLTPSSS